MEYSPKDPSSRNIRILVFSLLNIGSILCTGFFPDRLPWLRLDFKRRYRYKSNDQTYESVEKNVGTRANDVSHSSENDEREEFVADEDECIGECSTEINSIIDQLIFNP